ncbi:MAG: alpha-amylase family protein, partial [Bryobacteraceae bacterium]
DAGIEFVAYYNVGLDNWMAVQHPEWCCLDPQGKPKIAFGAYNWMCIRSPWRNLVLDELRQMELALHPEAMWFDILGAPNAYGVGSYNPGAACFCRYCKAAYQAKFGVEPPVSSNDPAIRRRANRFGQEARVAMLRDSAAMLRSIDPKVGLGYNGAGLYDDLAATPQDMRDVITQNSSEAKQYRAISFTTKSLWALGKPFQVHTFGGFTRMEPGSVDGTWSAWNLIPAPYLEISAAIVSAHAGQTSLGVNPLPDGTIYEGELQRVGQVFAPVAEREQWLAGLKSVPNVAVVYDVESELRLLPLPETKGTPVRQETTGLHDALLDAGIHFDVVQSTRLDPTGYRAILLGNAVCPSEHLRASLTRFVREGGLLIATAETSLRDEEGRRRSDFGWSDLLGVQLTGTSPYAEANYAWLGGDLRGNAPAYPLLFRTPVLEVKCTSAVKLAELVYPEGHRSPTVFTDGETPYTHFKQFTGKPLVTLNRVGRGSVIYISPPIGREIEMRQDPWLKRLVGRCVTRYAAGLAIEMQAPAGIQVVFGRKPGASVVSLVNVYGGLAPGTDQLSLPQVGPVRLTVQVGSRPASIRLLGGSGLDWKYRGRVIDVSIQSVGHHALLIVA